MPTKTAQTHSTHSAVTLPHRLHTLLHTVRTIAHFEDELCTLLHAAEHTDKLSPELAKELTNLLTRMPANEYVDDLDDLRAVIDIPAARRPRTAKQISSKTRKPFRAKAASARPKIPSKPKARKAKS